jgi:hypothetical protein
MVKKLVLVMAVVGIVAIPVTAVAASPQHLVLAQGTDTEEGEGGQEGQGGEGEGQGDPEAETDPGAGEEAVAEEEGPPWTYQMARMSIGLVVLLLAGTAFLYYRMIGARQRNSA